MKELTLEVPDKTFTIKFGENKTTFKRMNADELKEFQEKFGYIGQYKKMADDDPEKTKPEIVDSLYDVIEFLMVDTTISISEIRKIPLTFMVPLVSTVMEEQGLDPGKKK